MILKQLVVDDFQYVYGDHTMSMHDFNIQIIGIEISYIFSSVYMKNSECAFMLALSDIFSY